MTYDERAQDYEEHDDHLVAGAFRNFNEVSRDSEVASVHDTRASVYSQASAISSVAPVKMSTHRDTFVNSVNVLMGLGVLGLPYAFSHGGWLTLPLTLLMSALSCYTAHLLGVIQREVMLVRPPAHIPAEAAGMFKRKRDPATGQRIGGRAFVKKHGEGHWEVAWEKGRGWDMFLVTKDVEDVRVEPNPDVGASDASASASPGPSPSEVRRTDSFKRTRLESLPTGEAPADEQTKLLGEQLGTGSKLFGPQGALVTRLESYPDVARGAFGDLGYAAIQVLFCFELYLYVVSMIIVGVENTQVLTDQFTRTEITLIYGALLMPQSLVRDFSRLSFLSWIGAIASAMVMVSLIYFGFTQDGYVEGSNNTGSITEPADTSIFEPCTFPLSFALIMGALSGHSLFPSLRADMYKPMKYSNIVMWAFVVISVFYALTGIFGYLMYGTAAADMVTANFDPANPLTKVVAGCIVAVAYSKHGLNMNALSNSVEDIAVRWGAPDNWCLYGPVRVLLTAACVGGSLVIPNFHAVMGIVGAAFSAIISLGFPLGAHIVLFHEHTGYVRMGFHVVLLVFSVFFAITGTMLSVGIPLCHTDLAL